MDRHLEAQLKTDEEHRRGNELILERDCPRCGAIQGEKCRTSSGKRAENFHVDRRLGLHEEFEAIHRDIYGRRTR